MAHASARYTRIGGAPASEAITDVVDLIEPTVLAIIVHLRLAGQSLRVFTTERIAPRAGEFVDRCR